MRRRDLRIGDQVGIASTPNAPLVWGSVCDLTKTRLIVDVGRPPARQLMQVTYAEIRKRVRT